MKVTIISAERNSGKTTYIQNLINEDRSKYLGFLSLSNQSKNSFYLQDINSLKKIPLMDENCDNSLERIGRFYIHSTAFKDAKNLLLKQIQEVTLSKTIVIDEIGRLELSGKGFNELLRELISLDVTLLISVRKCFVKEVIRFYKLDIYNPKIIEVPFQKNF